MFWISGPFLKCNKLTLKNFSSNTKTNRFARMKVVFVYKRIFGCFCIIKKTIWLAFLMILLWVVIDVLCVEFKYVWICTDFVWFSVCNILLSVSTSSFTLFLHPWNSLLTSLFINFSVRDSRIESDLLPSTFDFMKWTTSLLKCDFH